MFVYNASNILTSILKFAFMLPSIIIIVYPNSFKSYSFFFFNVFLRNQPIFNNIISKSLLLEFLLYRYIRYTFYLTSNNNII